MSRRKKQVRQKFRDAVFTRDGFACRACGFCSSPERAEDELDAHHITDRNEMPNGGYVAENGVALCDVCHAKAEAFHCGEPVSPGVPAGGPVRADRIERTGGADRRFKQG